MRLPFWPGWEYNKTVAGACTNLHGKGSMKMNKIPAIDLHCDTIALIRSCSVQAENERKGLENGPIFFSVSEKELKEGIRLRHNGRHIDAERLKESGYFCQCLGLCASQRAANAAHVTPWEYLQQLFDCFDREVADCSELLRPAVSGSEMEANFRSGYVSAMKTMEDSMALGTDLAHLEEAYRRGVRMASLTWNFENDLAFGHRKTETGLEIDAVNGLKSAGREFIKAMEELGMLVDLSHLNDAGTADVLSLLKPSTPVIASHSNARALCGHARNLPDEYLKKIADRGGIIGINFWHAVLNEAYRNGPEKLSAVSDMCEHMKYIRRVAGIDSIGLGSDFDGITSETEISGCGEIQKLAEGMDRAGFTGEEIEKVFYKNVLRVFKDVLG